MLQGDADYKLDGTLAAIFPIYGEGPMWLEIYGLDAYAKASVLINEEGIIEVINVAPSQSGWMIAVNRKLNGPHFLT